MNQEQGPNSAIHLSREKNFTELSESEKITRLGQELFSALQMLWYLQDSQDKLMNHSHVDGKLVAPINEFNQARRLPDYLRDRLIK
jgi:hypothetical protein